MGWATAALEADMRDGTTYRSARRNLARKTQGLSSWRKGPQRRNFIAERPETLKRTYEALHELVDTFTKKNPLTWHKNLNSVLLAFWRSVKRTRPVCRIISDLKKLDSDGRASYRNDALVAWANRVPDTPGTP
jgi:hypothetical protein